MEAFTEAVAEAFGFGRATDLSVVSMVGSANRLWRLDAPSGPFIVKELSHDTPEHLPRRRRAARFERSVFDSGAVVMPEPVRAVDGETIVHILGSRAELCAVRVHRWLDGDDIRPPGLGLVGAAGASLHTIQAAGARWSTEPTGTIRWWDVDPLEVVDRLRASELRAVGDEAAAIATDALSIVAIADQLEGPWTYSHCDHKPENALAVDGGPAVLDWDECGHCHPRLEAVEAALRWAGSNDPRQAAFEAFLTGYLDAGGKLRGLTEPDFGKWIAALLGWFSFQGRRALGEWPTDTVAERAAAEHRTRASVSDLRRTLTALPRWASWWR